ncbi:low molecular weight protein-tyrosine-phosphatase [Paraburkholderia fungorum]|uniref:low molecular weight protein-tyrosine-phosphatase n=1 Tax=Paraburkholderia fungorum TaxID=134537 RepID=UPI0038783D95
MIDTVLVVCEGNICRSPMAAALLSKRLPNINVFSAGTRALVGRSADALAIQLMTRERLDISTHVAKFVTLERVREANLVLTMTKEQRIFVETSYPFSKGRVYRLGEQNGYDVVDPYRSGIDAFEVSLRQIQIGVTTWANTIIRLNN